MGAVRETFIFLWQRVDLLGALDPGAFVQPGKREDSERQQEGGYCMANSCGKVILIKEAESSGISEASPPSAISAQPRAAGCTAAGSAMGTGEEGVECQGNKY